MLKKGTMATVLLGVLLIGGALVNQRCSQANPKKGSTVNTSPTTSSSSGGTTTGSSGGDTSVTVPDMQTCNKAGKVWIPTALNCLENLTAWACCDAQVLARFTDPSIYSDSFIANLQTQMKNWTSQNYKLYNCGQVDANNYNLYYIIDNGDGNYLGQVIKITNTPATEPKTTVTCP